MANVSYKKLHRHRCVSCKQRHRDVKKKTHPRWIDRRKYEFTEGIKDSFESNPPWLDLTFLSLCVIGGFITAMTAF